MKYAAKPETSKSSATTLFEVYNFPQPKLGRLDPKGLRESLPGVAKKRTSSRDVAEKKKPQEKKRRGGRKSLHRQIIFAMLMRSAPLFDVGGLPSLLGPLMENRDESGNRGISAFTMGDSIFT